MTVKEFLEKSKKDDRALRILGVVRPEHLIPLIEESDTIEQLVDALEVSERLKLSQE